MKEWIRKSLVDISIYLNRGITPLYSNDGILIINQKCIRDNRITYGEARFSNYKKKIPSDKLVQIGDILVNSTGIGTLGRTAQIKELTQETSVDSHITIVRLNDCVNKWYVGFQLAFNEPVLDRLGQGSTQQTELSRDDLGEIEILLPPLNIQDKIVSILFAYDNLIENNIKQISLLEESAKIIYREYILKYSPIKNNFKEINLGALLGYEIGGGWGEENQSNVFSESAYVIRGTDIYELLYGKTENVPFRYHKKSNLASRKLQDGDIIFEVSGGSQNEGVAKTLLVTSELLNQFNGDVMCASFCKLARPAKRELSNFLFLFLQFLREVKGSEVFEIRSASNIVNYNWTAFLKFQKVKLPDDKTLEKFNEIIDPIYKQIYNLGHQNKLLKEARDILLPRLMTGIINISDFTQATNSKMTLVNADSTEIKNKVFRDAVLISILTDKFSNINYPLGRKRYTKLSYLFHRHVGEQISDYLRKAAGPYNPNTKYKGPEKIAIKNGYIKFHKHNNYSGFVSDKNISDAYKYFNKYWVKENLDWLLTFKLKTNDELELYTTVDNAILELLSKKIAIDTNEVKRIITEEKEWRQKLSKNIFSDKKIKEAIDFLTAIFNYQL